MPNISEQNLVLYKAQDQTNNFSGGGRYGGQTVIDNQSNNLFLDVSSIDRATGQIDFRKIFAGVNNNQDDELLGAMAYVASLPQDPAIKPTLFTNGDNYDFLSTARNDISNYWVATGTVATTLTQTIIAGQNQIVLPAGLFAINEVIRIAVNEIPIAGQTQYYEEYFRIIGTLEQTTTTRLSDAPEINVTYILDHGANQDIIYQFNNGQLRTNVVTVRRCQADPNANYYSSITLSQNVAIGAPHAHASSLKQRLLPSSHIVAGENLPPAVSTLPQARFYSEFDENYLNQTVNGIDISYQSITSQSGQIIATRGYYFGVSGLKVLSAVVKTSSGTIVESSKYTVQPSGAIFPNSDFPTITNGSVEYTYAGYTFDGMIPIFRVGGLCVLSSSKTQALGGQAAGQTYPLNHDRIAFAEIYDSLGVIANKTLYTVDYDLGEITLGGDWTMAGLTAPLSVRYRYEDLSMISEILPNGRLTLAKPPVHEYNTADSIVGSCAVFGTQQARYDTKFELKTWASVFEDAPTGDPIGASLNDAIYPIEVTNQGAVTERWAIVFTSANAFKLVGEEYGEIATGTIGADFMPMNLVTNAPYFKIDFRAFGTGWATGNAIRFNTYGALNPLWVMRTTSPSDPTGLDYDFTLVYRGDIDRP